MQGAKREEDAGAGRADIHSEPDKVRRDFITNCFGRGIKKARGRNPAPLGNYLFLAVLRRAVPVFFAVVFFAAAVLRAGFFFAVFFFATAMMHPSFGLAGC
jgi:hypothetical protein